MLALGREASYLVRVSCASRHRPSFLLVTTLLAAATVSLGGLLAESATSKEARADYKRLEQRESYLERAEERRWVPVQTAEATRFVRLTGVQLWKASAGFRLPFAEGVVRGTAPGVQEIESVLPVLHRELSRYSPGFLGRAGLRHVLLCQELSEAGAAIPSLPNVDGTLLLSAEGLMSGITAEADSAYLARLIHHELFHFLDFADNQLLRQDVHWAQLNQAGFVYHTGGRHMRDGDAGRLGSGGPGFLTRYATSALEEDKAEVFAFLMTAPEAALALAARDSVLERKVLALRAQVTAFDPTFRL